MTENPAYWYWHMVKAIAGIQRKDYTHANEYTRYVKARRGVECAKETQVRLERLAKGKAFANASEILAQLGKTPMEFID